MGAIKKIAVLVVLTLLSISFVRSLVKVKAANERIRKAQEKVEKLKAENAAIEVKLKEIQSLEYKEKTARDKLGLAKPGEIVLVLPDEETLRALSPKIIEEEDTLPPTNWQKWIKLFF